MKKRIIAIDFGTCNTYLSQSNQGGPAEEFNISVGGNSIHGTKSIIMYCTKGDYAGKHKVGLDALDAYCTSSPATIQENGLQLASYFKPDIESSEQARQDSIYFLNSLLVTANKNKLQIDPSETDIFFGVPSEASEGYRSCLRDIAEKAGWGKVRLLDEPFGALFYEVGDSDEKTLKNLLHENVLVVDFGGGTCDFVILENGDIKRSWGDMLLGGRLFDDLFYQWVIDCSKDSDDPLTEERLMKRNKDFYLRSVKCQELKEKFSIAMGYDKSCPYKTYFWDRYDLKLKWDDFVQRAKNYHPSQSFMNKTDLPSNLAKSKFNPEGTTDIFNWFEEELLKGFSLNGVPINSIDKVLLAGGSSMWPFVIDACERIFGEEKLLRCANPFAAISMGLVRYCKFKDMAMGKSQTMEQEAKEQKEKLVQRIFNFNLSDSINDMLKQKAADIFEKYAMPELRNFAKNGGMLKNLEQSLSSLLNRNPTEINKILFPVFKNIGNELKYTLINDIKSWFESKGINPNELDFGNIDIDLPEFTPTSMDGNTGVATNIGTMIAEVIVATIILILISMSFAFWPLWLIIGPILTIGGAAAVENWARTTSWSPSWAAWLISGDVIPKLREKFNEYFTVSFSQSFAAFKQNNKDNIERAVDSAVDQALALYRKVANMERGTRAGGSAGDAFNK